jgi:hypothetical protein
MPAPPDAVALLGAANDRPRRGRLVDASLQKARNDILIIAAATSSLPGFLRRLDAAGRISSSAILRPFWIAMLAR